MLQEGLAAGQVEALAGEDHDPGVDPRREEDPQLGAGELFGHVVGARWVAQEQAALHGGVPQVEQRSRPAEEQHVAVEDHYVRGQARQREVRELEHERIFAPGGLEATQPAGSQLVPHDLVCLALEHEPRVREVAPELRDRPCGRRPLYVKHDGIVDAGLVVEALERPDGAQVGLSLSSCGSEIG